MFEVQSTECTHVRQWLGLAFVSLPSLRRRSPSRLIKAPASLEVRAMPRPHLLLKPIQEKQVFHRFNGPIQDVIFLNGGVASVTTVMQNGTMVETATIGDEGLVGIEACYSGTVATGEVMLQVPDSDASFIAVKAFREELDRRAALFERCAALFTSLDDADDAVHRVHGGPRCSGAMLPMAADGARPDKT
jgi:hypothetical protein